MIHLPLPNQHHLRIQEMVVQPAPDLAFDFDPSAPTAVSDALFFRSALHLLPMDGLEAPLDPEMVEEAEETTAHAVQASLSVYKAPILEEAGVEIVPTPHPVQELDPEQSIRVAMDGTVPLISQEQWLAGVKLEVEDALCKVPFSQTAAAITLTGIRMAEHFEEGRLGREARAVRKQARDVAARYFQESHMLRNAASRTLDIFTWR